MSMCDLVLEWGDVSLAAAFFKLDPWSTQRILRDLRSLSSILEERLALALKGQVVEVGIGDLVAPDGGLWEVRGLSGVSPVTFGPANLYGGHRKWSKAVFEDALRRLAGYWFVDVRNFPSPSPCYRLDISVVWSLWLKGDLGLKGRISTRKVIELLCVDRVGKSDGGMSS